MDTLPGTALKSFPYEANKEQLLYTFSAAAGEAPHTITEQWFAFFGGKQRYELNADMRIRIYIDGESPASLDFHALARALSPALARGQGRSGSSLAYRDPDLGPHPGLLLFESARGAGLTVRPGVCPNWGGRLCAPHYTDHLGM